MPLSKFDLILRELAAQASTWRERLSLGLSVPGPLADRKRLEHWMKTVDRHGRQEIWEKYLQREGLSADDCERAMAEAEWPGNLPLPGWTKKFWMALSLESGSLDRLPESMLRSNSSHIEPLNVPLSLPSPRALHSISQIARGEGEGEGLRSKGIGCSRDSVLPFEDFLFPFVRLYARRMETRWSGLAEPVRSSFCRDLLRRLCRIAAPTLLFEFQLFQSQKNPTQAADSNDVLYRSFLAELSAASFLPVFREYPVLARWLVLLTDQAVATTSRFLDRLANDEPRLSQVFARGEKIGTVLEIEGGLSDPHNGGESSWQVHFSSGLQLIYKPRSLGMAVAFNGLVEWLNSTGAVPTLKAPKALDCGSHGWMEVLQREDCRSEREVVAFYERGGAVLGLAQLLDGSDCHHQNVIYCGQHPVLVDHETLLQPRASSASSVGGGASSMWRGIDLAKTVFQTGLLPVWLVEQGGQLFDQSGFGVDLDPRARVLASSWRNINMDGMSEEDRETPSRKSSLALNGRAVDPQQHRESFVAGFRALWELVVSQREFLLGSQSPLKAFAPLSSRFVSRDTQLYQKIIARLGRPEQLRDGRDFSVETELLARAHLLPAGSGAIHWGLFESERLAVSRGDIPLFMAPVGGRSLALETGECIPDFFERAAYDELRQRVKSIELGQIETEAELIRVCWKSRFGTEKSLHSPSAGDSQKNAASNVEFIDRAIEVAELLSEVGFARKDGGRVWFGPCRVPERRRIELRPIGWSLYDGASGVLLFLAALESVAPGQSAPAVESLLRIIRERCGDAGGLAGTLTGIGIGGATGLGSLVYSFSRAGTLLGNEWLLDEAARLARYITDELIAADRAFDVMAGSAGTILSLLSLHQSRAEDWLIDRARACGRHLLERRAAGPSGFRLWPSVRPGKFRTGFAHGAAGIALALLRLEHATGEKEFGQAAAEALAFERGLFIKANGNWPEFSDGEESGCRTAWCAGATGIGLSRLGMLAFCDSTELKEEIRASLSTSDKAIVISAENHLCCGNFGRIELLVAAGKKLCEPRWSARACEVAEKLLAGDGNVFGRRSLGFLDPGFFRGLSGIGYELLRLAAPDRIPSVLLWE